MLCSCCGEFESNLKCSTDVQNLCVNCAKIADSVCIECGCQLDESVLENWSPEHRVHVLCDHCKEQSAKSENVYQFIIKTKQAVEDLCDEFGWDIGHWNTAQTGSMYVEAHKECPPCILGLDKDCECDSVKIRISDHATAYCSEDFSISMNGSGDDHTLQDLKKFFERNN